MLFLLFFACMENSEEKQDTAAEDVVESIESEPENVVDTATEDPCGWEENQGSEPLSLAGDRDCGAEVYAESCAICHMEDGSGGNSGKRLKGRIELFEDQTLIDIIVSGQGTMPPIALSSQETADVVVFLRNDF